MSWKGPCSISASVPTTANWSIPRFRALHTIKGSGAMFGFDKVAVLHPRIRDRLRSRPQGRDQADAGTDLGRARRQGLYPRADRGSGSRPTTSSARPSSTTSNASSSSDAARELRSPRSRQHRRSRRSRASRPAGSSIWNSNPISCATARTRSICWKISASSVPASSCPSPTASRSSTRSSPKTAI